MGVEEIPRLREEIRLVKQQNSLTTLREEFEERKAVEWEAIRASHQGKSGAVQAAEERLAQVVSDLFNEGVTKRQLCNAYGTKDYGTINRLIAKGGSIKRPTSLNMRLDDLLTGEHGVDIWAVDAINYGKDRYTGTVHVYADTEGFPTLVGDITDDFRGTQLHRELAGSASGDFFSLWGAVAGPSRM